jgi:hypothetical protein
VQSKRRQISEKLYPLATNKIRGSREFLEQEAGELVLFVLNPGPRRRISHSSIREVDEKRVRELGPATDFHLIGDTEIYFYSS